MNKLKEKDKSQKGERNLISYCKIPGCVTSLFTPLKVLVFAVFVPRWLPSNILFCSFSFLSRICPDRDSLVKDAVDLASQISKKSPIAMSGTKHNLNYSRDHSTKEGLEYMVSF